MIRKTNFNPPPLGTVYIPEIGFAYLIIPRDAVLSNNVDRLHMMPHHLKRCLMELRTNHRKKYILMAISRLSIPKIDRQNFIPEYIYTWIPKIYSEDIIHITEALRFEESFSIFPTSNATDSVLTNIPNKKRTK